MPNAVQVGRAQLKVQKRPHPQCGGLLLQRNWDRTQTLTAWTEAIISPSPVHMEQAMRRHQECIAPPPIHTKTVRRMGWGRGLGASHTGRSKANSEAFIVLNKQEPTETLVATRDGQKKDGQKGYPPPSTQSNNTAVRGCRTVVMDPRTSERSGADTQGRWLGNTPHWFLGETLKHWPAGY